MKERCSWQAIRLGEVSSIAALCCFLRKLQTINGMVSSSTREHQTLSDMERKGGEALFRYVQACQLVIYFVLVIYIYVCVCHALILISPLPKRRCAHIQHTYIQPVTHTHTHTYTHTHTHTHTLSVSFANTYIHAYKCIM
jgi:hypothetical protein